MHTRAQEDTCRCMKYKHTTTHTLSSHPSANTGTKLRTCKYTRHTAGRHAHTCIRVWMHTQPQGRPHTLTHTQHAHGHPQVHAHTRAHTREGVCKCTDHHVLSTGNTLLPFLGVPPLADQARVLSPPGSPPRFPLPRIPSVSARHCPIFTHPFLALRVCFIQTQGGASSQASTIRPPHAPFEDQTRPLSL